jgi:hypothetical protein
MTTVELERIARDVVWPAGETLVAVVEVEPCGRLTNGTPSGIVTDADGTKRLPRTRYGVAFFDGIRRSRPAAMLGSQRDTYRLMDILEGRAPTSRGARNPLPAAVTGGQEPDRALPEAPQSLTSAGRTGVGSDPRADASGERTPGGASLRLCEGCDEPLPEGARPNRTTHDGACRVRAARRRAAAKAGGVDDSGAHGDVTVSGAPAVVGPCVEWTGARQPGRGYGRLGIRLAHRLAYEQARGPIPDGLVIDHLCRNTGCVNPDHLEAVTQAVNVQRGLAGGLTGRCRTGRHEKAANYRVKPSGKGYCKACNDEHNATYQRDGVAPAPRSGAEESPTASTAGPGELDAGPLRPFEASAPSSVGASRSSPAAAMPRDPSQPTPSHIGGAAMSGIPTTAYPARPDGVAVQLVLPAPAT